MKAMKRKFQSCDFCNCHPWAHNYMTCRIEVIREKGKKVRVKPHCSLIKRYYNTPRKYRKVIMDWALSGWSEDFKFPEGFWDKPKGRKVLHANKKSISCS